MALPQRCKKCRCYIAPHLVRCPRCNTVSPVMAAPTSEDRATLRAREDEKVTTIHARKMRWVPPIFAVEAHEHSLRDLKKKLERTDTKRGRNAVRSEIRSCTAIITRGRNRDGAWAREYFRTKHAAIPVIVSPKGYRYVVAPNDVKADLIIINGKRSAFPFTRMQRFERSRYARMVKDDVKEARVQKKRKAAKKERVSRRQKLPTLS